MDKKLVVAIVQVIIVLILVTVITLFIRLNSAVKLEKRISKYSVRYKNNKVNLSIFEKIWRGYLKFVKMQRRKIRGLFPTLIKRYDKYVTLGDMKSVDYVTHKFVIAILFILLTIMALSIQGKFITLFQLIFSFVLGFYILDLVLIIQEKLNKKKIENDMLRAIIIMNNAFKSGKSTVQAVEIVSKKMPKPIGEEFRRITQEMKYGLSMDQVFDRFSRRVNIPEAEYLSSSLTILNRTGGNIVAVFDSIEKTLFDKKKLEEELKNSITVSKLVVRILLVVPFLFVGIIYLLNPEYFNPFFHSTMGYIILGIILFMFLLYAYLLQRIVKVTY